MLQTTLYYIVEFINLGGISAPLFFVESFVVPGKLSDGQCVLESTLGPQFIDTPGNVQLC